MPHHGVEYDLIPVKCEIKCVPLTFCIICRLNIRGEKKIVKIRHAFLQSTFLTSVT